MRHGTEPDVQYLDNLAVGLSLSASVEHLLRERKGVGDVDSAWGGKSGFGDLL